MQPNVRAPTHNVSLPTHPLNRTNAHLCCNSNCCSIPMTLFSAVYTYIVCLPTDYLHWVTFWLVLIFKENNIIQIYKISHLMPATLTNCSTYMTFLWKLSALKKNSSCMSQLLDRREIFHNVMWRQLLCLKLRKGRGDFHFPLLYLYRIKSWHSASGNSWPRQAGAPLWQFWSPAGLTDLISCEPVTAADPHLTEIRHRSERQTGNLYKKSSSRRARQFMQSILGLFFWSYASAPALISCDSVNPSAAAAAEFHLAFADCRTLQLQEGNPGLTDFMSLQLLGWVDTTWSNKRIGLGREVQVKRFRYQLWTHRQLKPPSVYLTWRLRAAFVLLYFVLYLFIASRAIMLGLQIHPDWAKKYKEYK